MKKSLRFVFLACLLSIAHTPVNAVEVGQPAPPFTLNSFDKNQPVNLSQYAGKVIYLDFWASWCAPCRVSFPLLNKLHQKLQAKGFEVVAVNLDEDKAKADKFLQDYPVKFQILTDPNGQWADKFGVESMPTSYIIDKKGVVQNIHHGFASGDITELEAKINQLLTQK